MGMNWAEHTVEIDAPIETSFAAIVDYESFPRWQDAVDSVEVISRDGDGLGQDVRLFVDAKVRKIDYVLRYSYKRPTEIYWDFLEGNGMRDCDGVYTLEELGPERSRATYKLGADPAIPVPGLVLRRTHKQLVKRSVEDLKREAERRHAAGESTTAANTAPAEEPGGSQTPEPEEAGPEPAQPEAPARDAAEPAAPEPEAPRAEDDWVPKAVRDTPPPPRVDEPPRARPSGHDALTELPIALLGKAVSTGREVADTAVRAGIGAAEAAAGVGREAADGLLKRISRKLGADRGDER